MSADHWNTLMDGFLGNLLVAVVTAAIPLVSAAYARYEANKTAPDAKLPRLAAKITSILGIYEIGEARQFKVAGDTAFTHPHLDLVVAVALNHEGTGWRSHLRPWINLTLPGASTTERHEDIPVGWCRIFQDGGSTYRLTLVKRDPALTLTFQLRIIGTSVAPS